MPIRGKLGFDVVVVDSLIIGVFVGFALAAALGINLVVTTIIAAMFAYLSYQIKLAQMNKVSISDDADDEEDI